eukprot:tig00000912_g5461.t1
MRCERSGRGEELEDHAYRRQCTAQIAGSQPVDHRILRERSEARTPGPCSCVQRATTTTAAGASKTEKGSERRSFDVRAAAPEELRDAAAALRWRRRKRGRELLRQLPKEATGLLVDLVSGTFAAAPPPRRRHRHRPLCPCRPPALPGESVATVPAPSARPAGGTGRTRHDAELAGSPSSWRPPPPRGLPAGAGRPGGQPLIEFLRSVELGYCARLHVEQRRRPSEGGIGSARRAARAVFGTRSAASV